MADTFGKRTREMRKRRKRELKAERKVQRKEQGVDKEDVSGLFWVPDENPPRRADSDKS